MVGIHSENWIVMHLICPLGRVRQYKEFDKFYIVLKFCSTRMKELFKNLTLGFYKGNDLLTKRIFGLINCYHELKSSKWARCI